MNTNINDNLNYKNILIILIKLINKSSIIEHNIENNYIIF